MHLYQNRIGRRIAKTAIITTTTTTRRRAIKPFTIQSTHRFHKNMSLNKTNSLKEPSIIAERIEHRQLIHGEERIDHYYWLRERENPVVAKYLESENEFQEEQLAHTKELQQKLYEEIVYRMNEDDISAPYKHGNWMYYYRTEKGKQYRIYCRKQYNPDGKQQELEQEQVLLDLNRIYEDMKLNFLSLGVYRVSPDHSILAYALDTTGGEVYTCYFKDLRAGKVLKDKIEKMGCGFQWANDSSTCFYTQLDHALRPYQIYRKHVNLSDEEKSPSPDELLFTDEDERFWVKISKSLSGQYLFLGTESKITSEYWFLDANNPMGKFQCIKKRTYGLEYSVAHQGNYFYILENSNGYRNFRLVQVPAGSDLIESFENAEEVFPYDDNRMMDHLICFKEHIAIFIREEGLPKIIIMDPQDSSNCYYVTFPDAAYSVSAAENREYDSHFLRITYSSFITPDTTFDYDMVNRKFIVRKEKVVKGYEKALYAVERINITARDGVKVPISMVYKKQQQNRDSFIKKDGTNPMYLYSYGSYGHPLDCYWMDSAISLLDRGIIFAIAHIRGGGENGRYWRDEGRMEKKMNTFNDFIDCAKYLISSGYTSPDRLCISGASAGGLLIGATVNMNPELFAAAVLRVPFVDCVNTMLDASIPLTDRI